MNGSGRMGYVGRGRRMGPRWGRTAPVSLVASLLVGAVVFLFAVAAFSSHLLPVLFLFGWMVPFLLAPALGVSARGITRLLEGRSPRLSDEDKEKELLTRRRSF